MEVEEVPGHALEDEALQAGQIKQAVLQGLGRDQGLFFPREFKELPDVQGLLQESFVTRSAAILHHLIGDEISEPVLQSIVASAFDVIFTANRTEARSSIS